MFHQASTARTNIIYACGGYGSTRGEEGFWLTAGTLHFQNNISTAEPPPLKWSAPIVRKRRTIDGHQETQAEARNETGATLLVLAGGQTVPASAINALREA